MIFPKKLIVYLGSGLSLLALALGAYLLHYSAIYVNLTNGTSWPVSKIQFTYRGGQLAIPQLESGASGGGYVFPSTETHLTLSYEARGADRQEEIEMYMEPGYRGRVDIVVTDERIITR